MKRAIALSGGGTKGSYELGVWKAIKELDIDYQIVTGTSIGSINGALMVTEEYDRACDLWNTITMDDMMEDGINLTATIEGMFDQKAAIRPFLKKYIKNKGADISPFAKYIEQLIDEEIVRKSKIDFGLVTVQFPSLKAYELQKKDIPEGLLKDYILASAAIFPLFPMHKIGKETYLDGCYHDNLPIDLALRMGATDVIAIDLHTTPAHMDYATRPYVTYIKPSRSLGTMMNFDHALLMENIEMGYQDAMKSLGKLLGFSYTFYKEGMSKCRNQINKFTAAIARTDLVITDDAPGRKLSKKEDFNHLYAILACKAEGEKLSKEACFISGGEVCAEIFRLEIRKIYQISEFKVELLGKIEEKSIYTEIFALLEKEGIELANTLAELKLKRERDYITGCIYFTLMEKKKMQEKLQFAILTLFPKELAAALFLLSITEVE